MAYVAYDDVVVATTGEEGTLVIPMELTRSAPYVNWTLERGESYTVLLYDMDAPYPPPHNSNSPYMHFMAVNVGGSHYQGDTVLDYEPPSPPADSPPHRYTVEIYLQPSLVRARRRRVREKFRLRDLERKGFQLLHRLTFEVDPQARESRLSERKPEKYGGDRFREESDLPERQKKYCSCVLDVAARQPPTCNREKAWFQKREGAQCYNPYSVCASSVGTSSRRCGESYAYENLPDNELVAYASLLGLPVDQPYNRQTVLEDIHRYKEEEISATVSPPVRAKIPTA